MKIAPGVSAVYKLSFFTRRVLRERLVDFFHDPFWILGTKELWHSPSLTFAMRCDFEENRTTRKRKGLEDNFSTWYTKEQNIHYEHFYIFTHFFIQKYLGQENDVQVLVFLHLCITIHFYSVFF